MKRLSQEEIEIIQLTDDHIVEVHTAMDETDQGEYVAEADMAAFWEIRDQ